MTDAFPAMSTNTVGAHSARFSMSSYVAVSSYRFTFSTKPTFADDVNAMQCVLPRARTRCAKAIAVLLEALLTTIWPAPNIAFSNKKSSARKEVTKSPRKRR